ARLPAALAPHPSAGAPPAAPHPALHHALLHHHRLAELAAELDALLPGAGVVHHRLHRGAAPARRPRHRGGREGDGGEPPAAASVTGREPRPAVTVPIPPGCPRARRAPPARRGSAR